MEFLGISMWELLLILVVAVIVLGPNKIPGIARNIGKAIRAIKKASSDLSTVITKEIESENSAESPRETVPTHHPVNNSSPPDTAGTLENDKQSHEPKGQPPQDEQR